MSWLTPNHRRGWRQGGNYQSSHENYQRYRGSPRYGSPRSYPSPDRFNIPSPQYRYHNSQQQIFSHDASSAAPFELIGGYRSQRQFEQKDRDPYFQTTMMENPWIGLEEDFDEVRDELLENAEELVSTIPMTMSNWLRKKPRSQNWRQLLQSRKESIEIVKLANTVSQIESQLEANVELPMDVDDEAEGNDQGNISADIAPENLLAPSEFQIEIENDMMQSEVPEICHAEDGRETQQSPLKPAMFEQQTSKIDQSTTNIQSPPVINSQPVTPNESISKPTPLQQLS